jgi:hypothetical protein
MGREEGFDPAGGARHGGGPGDDEGSPESRVAGVPRVSKALERAELFFGCLVFFAGLFYLTREAKTDAQWYFRVVSFFVGAAGFLVVQLLKRRR